MLIFRCLYRFSYDCCTNQLRCVKLNYFATCNIFFCFKKKNCKKNKSKIWWHAKIILCDNKLFIFIRSLFHVIICSDLNMFSGWIIFLQREIKSILRKLFFCRKMKSKCTLKFNLLCCCNIPTYLANVSYR